MQIKKNCRCRICQTIDNHPVWIAREMMFGTGENFEYFQCTCCSCLQLLDIPDLSKHYPANYYSLTQPDLSFLSGLRWKLKKCFYRAMISGNAFSKTLSRIILPKCRFLFLYPLRLKTTDRILDIGCGNGKQYLLPLRESGYSNVFGIDPFLSENIEYPNGLTIQKTTIDKIKDKFDLIMFHHSLEHIVNQDEVISSISSILNPNGTCIISIPVSDSFAWEKFSINWYQLDAPRHIFLHTRKSLALLLQHNGLQIVDVRYNSSFFQFVQSNQYKKNIPMSQNYRPSFLKRKIDRWFYATWSILLNKQQRGDQAIFYIRHISNFPIS